MSLKNQAARGVKWTALSTLITALLDFVQMIVLARILCPADFGLMAMVLVVVRFAEIFSDMGVSSAIIYRRDTTRDHLSSLFWLNIMAGVAVTLCVLVAKPLVVSFYHEPRLSRLISLAACIFLVGSLGQQFQVLLQKVLQFNRLAFIQVSEHVVRGATAIILALYGLGAASLVAGHMAGVSVRVALLFCVCRRDWMPRFHFSMADLKGYAGFGLYQMGNKGVNFFNLYLIQLLIGRVLGASALGFYTLAFDLVLRPIGVINPIITRVAFPVFSMIQGDAAMVRRGYLKMLRFLSLVNFPLTLGIGAVAGVAVPVIYGDQWMPSVVLVQILSVLAMLYSTGNPVGSLLLSHGRADRAFYWNMAKIAIQFPVLYAGIVWTGLTGGVWASLCVQCLFTCLAYGFLVRPVLGPCLRVYTGSMWPAFWMSLVMVAGVLLLGIVLPEWLSRAIRLALLVGWGMAIYLALLVSAQKEIISEIKRVVWSKP